MLITATLPQELGLVVHGIATTDGEVMVEVRSTCEQAPCPLCRQPAARVHSRYTRTLDRFRLVLVS